MPGSHHGIGNSRTVCADLNPSLRWVQKLATARGKTLVLRAVDGDMVADRNLQLYGFTPAAGDDVSLQLGIVDLAHYGSDPVKMGYYQRGLDAAVINSACPVKVWANSPAMTLTGPWQQTQGIPQSRCVNFTGAKVKATISGTVGYFQAIMQWSTAATVPIKVRVDGGAPTDFTVTGGQQVNGSDAITTRKGLTFGGGLYSVPTGGPGTHEIEIEIMNAQRFYIDFICGNDQPANRPVVLVNNIARSTAAGYAPPMGGSDALVQLYNPIIANIVALRASEGHDVRLVDIYSEIDPATHMGPDGRHFNLPGSDKVFDKNLAVADGVIIPPADTYRDAVLKIRDSDDKAFAFDGTDYYPLN